MQCESVRKRNISIHASAKEATKNTSGYQLGYQFQSTPPRRRRHLDFLLTYFLLYFNPRLREGGDLEKYLKFSYHMISIHASAKEATYIRVVQVLLELEFQSTPPRRRRHISYCESCQACCISIHASAKEATICGIPGREVH